MSTAPSSRATASTSSRARLVRRSAHHQDRERGTAALIRAERFVIATGTVPAVSADVRSTARPSSTPTASSISRTFLAPCSCVGAGVIAWYVHGARNVREIEDAVGVDDGRAVDRYVRRYRRASPRGDHEPLRAISAAGPSLSILMVCGSTNEAWPRGRRRCCARTGSGKTSFSFWITWWHRNISVWMVMVCLSVSGVGATLLKPVQPTQRLRRMVVDADATPRRGGVHDGEEARSLAGLDRGVVTRRAAAEHDEPYCVMSDHSAPREGSTRRRAPHGLLGTAKLIRGKAHCPLISSGVLGSPTSLAGDGAMLGPTP